MVARTAELIRTGRLASALPGGAMLLVISEESILRTHRRACEAHATFALLGGFMVMMFLDATLG